MSSMPPPPPDSPPDDFVSVPPQAARNGLAIAALVLGILGLFACAPAGILAVVLGIIAFVRAQNQVPIYPGRAMAVAGICCGVLGTIIGTSVLLLPSLRAARADGKRILCALNLSQLARASAAYAADDNFDRLIPIHQSMIRADAKDGWRGTPWWWRTAQPHVFGGGTVGPYPTSAGNITVMQDEQGLWAARKRPLNRYLYGENFPQSLPLYHCPADRGYPNAKWVDDCSPEAVGLPCYEYLGNSYRIASCGLAWTSGQDLIGFFSTGVLGHALSAIENPSRTVLYAEPTFEGFTRPEAAADPSLKTTPGWHGRAQQDNVAYCDGSVRATLADTIVDGPDALPKQMNYTSAYPWTMFIRRGRTWQIDCAAPGVRIPMKDANGADISPVPEKTGGWPFAGYQDLP